MVRSNTQPTSPLSSSLDGLRTVEFRQVVRGYHTNEVDDYLERVAVEVEALQELYRQSNDLVKEETDRIAQLEQVVEQLQSGQSRSEPQSAALSDDTLQHMLMSAQEFVDETRAEAESEARVKVVEAEARARNLVREAEERARALIGDTERQFQEKIARLESIRTRLVGDVETVARYLENERGRLRSALGEMLTWIDEHVQPATSLLAQPPAESAQGLNANGTSSSTGESSSAGPVAGTTVDVSPTTVPGPGAESHRLEDSPNGRVGASH
jgi:cell division initiation protein